MAEMFELSTDADEDVGLYPTIVEARACARKLPPGTGYAIWAGVVEDGEFWSSRRVEWYQPHPDDFAPQDDTPSLDDHPWMIFQRGERE